VSTETAPAPVTTDTGDSDLDHVFCCEPTMALCGVNIAGDPVNEGEWTEDDPDLCVVCVDLSDLPCERCGAP
jgi:hypothetical protein